MKIKIKLSRVIGFVAVTCSLVMILFMFFTTQDILAKQFCINSSLWIFGGVWGIIGVSNYKKKKVENED